MGVKSQNKVQNNFMFKGYNTTLVVFVIYLFFSPSMASDYKDTYKYSKYRYKLVKEINFSSHDRSWFSFVIASLSSFVRLSRRRMLDSRH